MPPRTDWSRTDYRLTPRIRMEVREALTILEGSGISLTEAAQIAVSGKRMLRRELVSVAADRFKLSRARKINRRGKPLRPATLDWYEDFLMPLVRDFGDQQLDSIERGRFSAWLHGLKTGTTARTAIARACRALWRWALAENPPLVAEDVTLGVAFSAPMRSESERMVLTVAQARAMLEGAGWRQSAIALMLFAGIRPEEVAGDDKDWLRWEHVNASERWIKVPDSISKTGKTRLLEHLPPAVWEWVRPGRVTDNVSPVSYRTLLTQAKQAAGIRSWPHDCFRHTAATYLLALERDAGRVAEWIGHEGKPTLLHQTYRGMLTLDRTQVNHAMAQEYFGLRPPAA